MSLRVEEALKLLERTPALLQAWIPGLPRALLGRFAALRAEGLRAVRALELRPDDLARTGTHPDLGRVTLAELLGTWVVHDQAHTAQIARVLGKHFGDHVGPWRAYVNLLSK